MRLEFVFRCRTIGHSQACCYWLRFDLFNFFLVRYWHLLPCNLMCCFMWINDIFLYSHNKLPGTVCFILILNWSACILLISHTLDKLNWRNMELSWMCQVGEIISSYSDSFLMRIEALLLRWNRNEIIFIWSRGRQPFGHQGTNNYVSVWRRAMKIKIM